MGYRGSDNTLFSDQAMLALTSAPALKTARASSKAPRRENAWPKIFPNPLHHSLPRSCEQGMSLQLQINPQEIIVLLVKSR